MSQERSPQRKCSAKGCPHEALWALVWNNPRLHAAEREKRWGACDAHRETLADFLGRRGFLRRVDPATAATAWDS